MPRLRRVWRHGWQGGLDRHAMAADAAGTA
ncbi:hypothetical protein [Pseudoduganella ginsengisoli]